MYNISLIFRHHPCLNVVLLVIVVTVKDCSRCIRSNILVCIDKSCLYILAFFHENLQDSEELIHTRSTIRIIGIEIVMNTNDGVPLAAKSLLSLIRNMTKKYDLCLFLLARRSASVLRPPHRKISSFSLCVRDIVKLNFWKYSLLDI